MNHLNIYNKIIKKYKNLKVEGYSENHHIIPKCMGGDDEKENIVSLSAKAHFVAHHLLCKIYPESYKLAAAFNLMCCNPHTNKNGDRYVNSRYFHIARMNHAKNNPMKYPEVVEKMLQSRLDRLENEPDYIRRVEESNIEELREKRFLRNDEKWCEYHDTRKNLHVNGNPICKYCGKLTIRTNTNRDGVFCNHSCSNYYRYNGSKFSENDIEELMITANNLYNSLSVNELSLMRTKKDEKRDMFLRNKFNTMSDEDFSNLIENKAYSTRKRYQRLRKESFVNL